MTLSFPAGFTSSDFTYTGTYTWVDDDNRNWRIKFLTSGTLTIAKDTTVDIFCVGGGGGRGFNSSWVEYSGGGGGGRTNTVPGVVLTPGVSYTVTVGAGGASGSTNATTGGTGGASEILIGTTPVASANGGAGGQMWAGGSGGSGGGYNNGAGGSNGGNGVTGGGSPAGAGQGTTTREFGEVSGALYSPGGGSDRISTNATNPGAGLQGANSGAGGGNNTGLGNVGASGIVILRNHREVAA